MGGKGDNRDRGIHGRDRKREGERKDPEEIAGERQRGTERMGETKR